MYFSMSSFSQGISLFSAISFPFACFDYQSPELFISAISPVFDFLVNKVGVELMLTTELEQCCCRALSR